MHGGDIVAGVLEERGVDFIFTLCGGHISPILVACKQSGIQVIDVRHEATAAFAADAVFRLTGVPGVAAVTAGPGATNTLTAIKNAQLAQSALVLLGGATATALRRRGALQDIDQVALFKPHVKSAIQVERLRDLRPQLQKALFIAQSGVPGPVFVECPVDLLYDESLVRDWYETKSGTGQSLADRAVQFYLKRHVNRLFKKPDVTDTSAPTEHDIPLPDQAKVERVAARLADARRPVLLVGSQAVLETSQVEEIAQAVSKLGIPVYLSGMARGLMGRDHPLQIRHKRKLALRESDCVILAGVPCDFRLDYGRQIKRSTCLISANRSPVDLRLNRRPSIGVPGDPGRFLLGLAERLTANEAWGAWLQVLRERDEERNREICNMATARGEFVNPLRLCSEMEKIGGDDAIIVADGGDFVATASYVLKPRGPLMWLDPGAFGTLGVGAGFALGAKLCRPESEVWIVYGDGAVGYSLLEFDTFVRHRIPVVAVVGNDACWSQIAREQVEILHDDVATVLRHMDYHGVAEACGGKGYLVTETRQIGPTLRQARKDAAAGTPVLVNVLIDKSEFRKGSISM